MKALIISLLLIATGYSTNYYVSKSASGSGNASSWANADDLATFNWGATNPGDVVYIDGGADSLVYTKTTTFFISLTSTASGTSGNPLTITRDFSDPNHDGLPVFDADSSGGGMSFNNADYITVEWIKIKDCAEITISGTNNSNNVILQDMIINNPHRQGIRLTSCQSWQLLRDSIFTGYVDEDHEVDPIQFVGGYGHEIGWCYVMSGNKVGIRLPTSQHLDVLQTWNGYGIGSDYAHKTKIHHNLMISKPETNSPGSGVINMSASSGWFDIYNNIFVHANSNGTGTSLPTLFIPGNGGVAYVRCYNNFISADTTGVRVVQFTNCDSVWFYNNIVYAPICDDPMRWESGTMTRYIVADYNQYYINNPSQFNTGDADLTFTQWKAYGGLGLDAHGECFDAQTQSGSILLKSIPAYNWSLDKLDYALISGSSGIDEGTGDPWGQGIYSDDIIGTNRNTYAPWDAGAFEFIGGSLNSVNVKSKIYLQGPFNSTAGSMLTILNQSSLLPNSQPFNSPPWNYGGNENLGSGPPSTMVDWVLVELRSAANPTQVVARRAAIVKNNGLLLETNGVEGVNFNNVDAGLYYIAVFHRDHLAIMSAAPVSLSSNSNLYDFTTAMNKAYGQNPMVELVPGKFGMYAADGNADGVIDILDRDEIWLMQNGTMGYLEGDYNMNSGVTVHDVNQLWNINNGAVTRVP